MSEMIISNGNIGVGKMGVVITHENINASNPSGIKLGKLKLPEGVAVLGDLIAVGESDAYLHCFISDTGEYYGVFKSEDENHIYRLIKSLNFIDGLKVVK